MLIHKENNLLGEMSLMKHKIKSKVSLVFIVLISLSFISLSQRAEAAEDSVGFSFELEMPENSTKPDAGYYDLMMKPGQEQDLVIHFSNNMDKPITIESSINGAKTNRNGLVEYGESSIENDSSLKVDFKEIVKGPEKVTLKAKETKDVTYKVKMPKDKYDGVIVGGLQFVKEMDNDKAEGTQIINRYAYVVPIMLRETEVTLSPDLTFNQMKATSENGRNSILLNFSNTVSTFVKDMAVDVSITKKGSSEVLYSRKQNAMVMAPNSFMDFYISLNGDKMVAGKYTANILITGSDKEWKWEEEFTITDKEAKTFNEQDVNLDDESDVNWPMILIIGAVVIGIGVIFFLINKKALTTNKKTKRKKKKIN